VYDLKFEFVNASAFVLCVTFCAYVVSILIVYLRQAATPRGDGSGYSWHVIVPCLNEAAVIADTVRDLLNNFPDLVVWCVDDGSDDGTDEILAGLVHPRLHVVRRNLPEARQGKGAALNAGWRALRASLSPGTDTSRVLVGVVDADSRLDPNFRDVLAGPAYFGSSRVEAVQIEVRMINRRRRYRGVRASAWGRLLVTLQDMEFRGPIAAMQQLRKHTGSVGLGGNGQFTRLSALNMIAERYGTPWHGALLEDFELGLHVLLTGGRTEYCAETWVAQEGLTRIRALVRQRSRWSQGCMQCLRYLPQIFRSRRLGNSAVLEIAYFLAAPWIQLVGTVIYAACLGIMAWYAATEFGGFDSWSAARRLGRRALGGALRHPAVRGVGPRLPGAHRPSRHPAAGLRPRPGVLAVQLRSVGGRLVRLPSARAYEDRLAEDDPNRHVRGASGPTRSAATVVTRRTAPSGHLLPGTSNFPTPTDVLARVRAGPGDRSMPSRPSGHRDRYRLMVVRRECQCQRSRNVGWPRRVPEVWPSPS